MLDKLPIGEPEPKKPLMCELCGLDYSDEENREHIDETGYCVGCYK